MTWTEFATWAARIQEKLEAKALKEGTETPPAGTGRMMLALYLRKQGQSVPLMFS